MTDHQIFSTFLFAKHLNVKLTTYFTDVCCVVRRASRISPISSITLSLSALGGPQQLVFHLAERVPALGLYRPQLPAAEPCLPTVNLHIVDIVNLQRYSTVDNWICRNK